MAINATFVQLVQACVNKQLTVTEVLEQVARGRTDVGFEPRVGWALKQLVEKKLLTESFDKTKNAWTYSSTKEQATNSADDKSYKGAFVS